MRLERNLGIARSLNAGPARPPLRRSSRSRTPTTTPSRERLERQLAALAADPDVAVVGSRMREVDAAGPASCAPRTSFAAGDVGAVAAALQPDPQRLRRVPPRGSRWPLGGYDPRYRYATEYDLWLRLAERHRVVALDEELGTRVMGGANVAARAERAQLAEGIAIRVRALRRRRTLRGAGGLLRPALSYALPTPLKRARRRRGRRRGQEP